MSRMVVPIEIRNFGQPKLKIVKVSSWKTAVKLNALQISIALVDNTAAT